MVNQSVVDGNDTLGAVAGRGFLLQEAEAAVVELADVPGGLGEEAVEAGLVRGLGKLAVDATDVLAFGPEQTGEVFSEMATLRFVGQQVAEVPESLFDHCGEVDDTGHGGLQGKDQDTQDSVQTSRKSSAPTYLCKRPVRCPKHQFAPFQ